MPYQSNDDLPRGVRKLPPEEQTKWRKTFNAAYEQYKDDSKAAATAWASLEKRLDKVDWEGYVEFAKFDDERQIVFGWGSVTKVNGVPYVDSQEDMIEDSDLEDGVYDFMKAPMHDEMHSRAVPESRFVESIVITDEKLQKMFPGQPLPIGKRGWWVGVHMPDKELYQKHKQGTYKGFSITGTGVRVRKEVQ